MGRRKVDATLVLGDAHIPDHDESAFSLVFAILDRFAFTSVGSIGDLCDGRGASRHGSTGRQKMANLLRETDCTIEIAKRIKAAAKCECWITLGNHDEWGRRLFASMPELGFPRDYNVGYRLRHEAGWSVTPYQRSRKITKHLDATHDFGKAGKAAAMQAPGEYGRHVVFGHTHRAMVHYQGTSCGDLKSAMNVGWLGDPERIEYAHAQKVRANTVHGVGLVWHGPGGRFHLDFVPFFRSGGKLNACIGGEWVMISEKSKDPRASVDSVPYADPGVL